MSSLKSSPDTVKASLNYLDPSVEDPYQYSTDRTNNNIKTVAHEFEITNLRQLVDSKTTTPSSEKYSSLTAPEIQLDTSGFDFVKDNSTSKWFSYDLFSDDERIQNEYYPEVEKLLKEYLSKYYNRPVKDIVLFDYTIRRNKEGAIDQIGKRIPVQTVHADQTPTSARRRVERHYEFAAKYIGDNNDSKDSSKPPRYQLLNLWRPLIDNVQDTPLGLADFQSIDAEKDVVVSRLIYPDYDGLTYRFRFNPKHKWYYLGGQNTDEITLIKCFDSDAQSPDSKISKFTPHTAFDNPNKKPTDRLRESIEVRALVFYDD